MNTPIFDFVRAYADADVSRFHMPGHKGRSFLGCEALDITEINGADVLYAPDGVIAESESNASELFGTAHTFYSAEGSSLCIKAMLGLVAERPLGGRKPLILAARNVHKAFVYAAALLDLRVAWLMPKAGEHLCRCTVEPSDVRNALESMTEAPDAVYLTSPDYLGNLCDIAGIASVCREKRIPLLVDNAHGAYLRFLSPSQHPISLGATACCDSAHKTLPVLTGGAYLHISKDADRGFLQAARARLALFASTSPSYLILQSLDLCNRYLASDYSSRLQACIQRIAQVKARLAAQGFFVEVTEPLKLVLRASRFGYTGEELAEHLRAYRIEVEFADPSYLVLMATPETRDEDFERLIKAFEALTPKAAKKDFDANICISAGEYVLSIREAILSPRETVAPRDAVGRICASPTVSCPPAVPIVISGERITEAAARAMQHYGAFFIDVVKE
ncbi:MAG: amino acid decarboxylase [Clostridia bacterium]|nr:amino acid decarboxylase [Clostridia bacterium]